jgi:phosphoglycolate phosphatase-like HAD superfamily hydrolase
MLLALSAIVLGVILDIDGTLVDSNDLHAESWVDAFRAHGYAIPFGRVRPLMGMGGDRILRELASVAENSAEGEAIEATRRELFLHDYLREVRPFPGVRELLLRMREHDLELAVASSADEELREALLSLAGASDLIRRDGARPHHRSKPAPNPVLAALDLLGLAPDEAAMLGDTPYDQDAANAARVAFVGVRSGGWNDPIFADAVAVYDDAADILRRFDKSPFASRA